MRGFECGSSSQRAARKKRTRLLVRERFDFASRKANGFRLGYRLAIDDFVQRKVRPGTLSGAYVLVPQDAIGRNLKARAEPAHQLARGSHLARGGPAIDKVSDQADADALLVVEAVAGMCAVNLARPAKGRLDQAI